MDGSTRDWDAIVIGAGLGGLSTAAFLATNGLRVVVLEQNQVVGGCSQVFRRAGNRYEFDVGVHYIGDCAPGGTVDRLLHGLGLEDRIEFTELDPDGFSTDHPAGGHLPCPEGLGRLRAASRRDLPRPGRRHHPLRPHPARRRRGDRPGPAGQHRPGGPSGRRAAHHGVTGGCAR